MRGNAFAFVDGLRIEGDAAASVVNGVELPTTSLPSRPEMEVDRSKGSEMIAPCLCKGTAKWVHRHCLDEWRAVGGAQNRRNFSHCRECGFQFVIEPPPDESVRSKEERKRERRLLRLRARVLRYGCALFVAVQFVALGLGFATAQVDQRFNSSRLWHLLHDEYPDWLRDPLLVDETSIYHKNGIYYLYGLAELQTLIGLVVVMRNLCTNEDAPAQTQGVQADVANESNEAEVTEGGRGDDGALPAETGAALCVTY
ncbi:unnamed protein product [Amoebophrya sp. A25]|nr:unnamed protein product [Amoebophrya sp. A25]|eukprot:GSA25T00004298001.1